MSNASRRIDRWAAVVFLSMAAIHPTAMLALYLFYPPIDWRDALDAAMAPENGARFHFIHMATGAVLSWVAAALTTVAQQRSTLHAVFIGAAILSVSYAVAGMGSLAVVSAIPLWWCYRVARHEV